MEEVSQYSLKFRPLYFRDVYGQDATVKALKKRIIENDYPQAICLRGPFGCGKTSLAFIMAAAMMAHTEDGEPNWDNPDCKSILNQTFDRDVMLLDASRWSGKDAMLDFTQSIATRPLYSKSGIRVCIIEEADQASSAAMLSLLKILESPKSYNKFILCSMEDKGVPKSVLSRCQCYNIKSVDTGSIMYNLKHIMEQTGDWTNENIPQNFKLEGLATIANAAEGSMRVAVQFLERCIVNEAYTKAEITSLLEVVDENAIWEICDSLLRGEKNENILRSIIWMKSGDQVEHFFNYMSMMLAEAILYKETGVAADDKCEPRQRKLASMPELERLYYCLTLHPQMNKPYLRASDLVGCIASFYQGLDFRPKAPIVVNSPATPAANTTTEVAPAQTETLVRMREDITGVKGTIDHTIGPRKGMPIRTRSVVQAVEMENNPPKNPGVIGTSTAPEIGETKPGIRTRAPKTDISNLSIVF